MRGVSSCGPGLRGGERLARRAAVGGEPVVVGRFPGTGESAVGGEGLLGGEVDAVGTRVVPGGRPLGGGRVRSGESSVLGGPVGVHGRTVLGQRPVPGDRGAGDGALGRTQPPEAGTGKLADAYHLRDLLADVESIWQHRARQALRNGPSGDPVARWNATSTTALEAVSAHARLQATDAFLAAARQAPTPTTRILLERLCRLFLLTELAQHTGDLLAEERITAEQVRALPGAVDTLHNQLADELTTFVDAFDLPPQVLGAIPLTRNPPSLAEGEPPVPGAWASAPGEASGDAQ